MRDITPTSVGFSPSRLRRLDAHLENYVEDGRLAGLSALISRNGQIAYRATKGYADLDSRRPMTEDAVFRVFSMSKPVTSVAVMMLLEEGRLLLTDPVADHLAELGGLMVYKSGPSDAPVLEACDQPPTVAHLLSHTGGFGYGQDGHAVDRMYRSSGLFRRDEPIAAMVERLGRLPLKFQPGSRWEYSISHDVLGRLVEVVSGQRFDAFLEERLFAPMGMRDTGFAVPATARPRLASLYRPSDDEGIAAEDSAVAHNCTPPVVFFAGGEGLVSTVGDWHRFAMMLLGKGKLDSDRYLSPKSVELMTTNRLTPEQMSEMWMPGYGYGLGFAVLTDIAQHSSLGSIGEFTWAGSGSTYFWIDPTEQIIALLFAQFMPSSHYAIAREFKVLLYQALEC